MSTENKEISTETIVKRAISNIGNEEHATLNILTGEFKHPEKPVPLKLAGQLNTPKLYLEKRILEINPVNANVIVDITSMEIVLSVNEEDKNAKVITGGLQVSDTFKKMCVNNGKYYSTAQLASLFKMNRSAFANKSEGMALVTKLNNFMGTVDKEFEKLNNSTQKKTMTNQIVKSNLPELFELQVSLFKGQDKVSIECEFVFDVDDLTCTIVSADAQEKMDNYAEDLINSEIEAIKFISPTLLVTYK